MENLLHLFWNCNFVQDAWSAAEKPCNDLWYYSSIEYKGDNSSSIQQLHWESNYSKSYMAQYIINCYIYRCKGMGKITHLQKTYKI
jgi:hypothetical protein